MFTTAIRHQDRVGPSLVAASFLTVIFAFYAGVFLPFGIAGILLGALIGGLWALLLGFATNRLLRREAWNAGLANVPLFLGIVAVGLTIGGGYMYASMMSAALAEPTLTYSLLSALMQPAVPFYITLNSALELLLVPLIVFGNWNTNPRRRAFMLVGAGAYLVMRVWTYLVFAESRLVISQQPLTAADVEWFRQTLATDFRIVLNAITYVAFLLAAFIPVTALTQSAAAAAEGTSTLSGHLATQS